VFLDRAIELTEVGGTVCFVVPDSFLAGKYFSKIRKTILTYTNIQEILICFEDFWDEAQVGFPVIITLNKVSENESAARKAYFDLSDELHAIEIKRDKIKSDSLKAELDTKLKDVAREKQKIEAAGLSDHDFTVKFASSSQNIIQRKFTAQRTAQDQFYTNYNNRFTVFRSAAERKIYQRMNRVDQPQRIS
jgi:hypothetical protein